MKLSSDEGIRVNRTERPHEKLICWQKAIELVVEIYGISKAFPKEELFGLASQMRRAAVSIPANIAEGAARRGKTEKRHFYFIARGSLSELETHLVISRRIGYLDQAECDRIMSRCGHVAAMLNGMVRE
jgi:four helix bundle protein